MTRHRLFTLPLVTLQSNWVCLWSTFVKWDALWCNGRRVNYLRSRPITFITSLWKSVTIIAYLHSFLHGPRTEKNGTTMSAASWFGSLSVTLIPSYTFWGSLRCGYEVFCILGYISVYSLESQANFRRNILYLPPASRWILAWLNLRLWRWKRHFPPRGRLTSTDFTMNIPEDILLAALGPGVYSASNRNEYEKHKNTIRMILGSKVGWVCRADSPTAICEPIV
jgi:hypothetical protein